MFFFAKHIQLQNLKYLSKTTVFQIVDYICIFKSVGYRKLANIRKSKFASQLCKKIILNAFPFFWVKWVYHKLYIFQFQIFYTNWPSLLYRTYSICRIRILLMVNYVWRKSIINICSWYCPFKGPGLQPPDFFYQLNPPGSLTTRLKYYRLGLRFHRVLPPGSQSPLGRVPRRVNLPSVTIPSE